MSLLLAQGFGFAGSLACCLWSFAGTRRTMLLVQMLGSTCFLLHWTLLGRGTAAAMTGLLLVMAGLSLFLDAPPGSARIRIVRGIYLAALLPITLLAVATWAGPQSFFAAIGTAMACHGRWQTDRDRHRTILLASSVPWLVHSAIAGSIPGVCTDLFALGRGGWLAWQQRRAGAGGAMPAALLAKAG
ncbi:YgjV family protein [Belnapia rosea]|uniref:YgjV family protein n=1 Tax=Belnapia rosea TaxID=938405 RepID=UPI00088CBF96|nr:YgjV family protein [Belnapia rosea]SDB63233.1 inner membrane protein [Belnapia rosea]